MGLTSSMVLQGILERKEDLVPSLRIDVLGNNESGRVKRAFNRQCRKNGK